MKRNVRKSGVTFVCLVVLLCLIGGTAQGQTLTTLYSFGASSNDGKNPFGGLLITGNGTLYGTTEYGGTGTCAITNGSGCGTVYTLYLSGGNYTYSNLYSFTGGSDGAYPYTGSLITDGTYFYGTTTQDGSGATGGTVFRILVGEGVSENALWTFPNGTADGIGPNSSLVINQAGGILVATSAGGTGYGGIFELTSSNQSYTETPLFLFNGTDGSLPAAGLYIDSSGNVFGTTQSGGANSLGTVYQVGDGATILYNFTNANGDGENPQAPVIEDASGNLYGTALGGPMQSGVVYELSPGQSGYTEKILYTFSNTGNDGQYPYSGLLMDGAGNFYGTTTGGGTSGAGTVYELVNSGGNFTEKILYNFTGHGDGSAPYAALVFDSSGNLYGTTTAGGANGFGTVFQLAPNSQPTSETQTLTFQASTTPETQTATFGSANSKHTVSFTIPVVNDTFQVTETANYVDTEFSTGGHHGIGIADGVCEAGSPNNGTFDGVIQYPDNDIDCRLAAGGFVFATLSNGDQVVPHALPYHNGQAVWYRASTTAAAVSQGGNDYVGPVTDGWTWELNPPLNAPPVNPEYAPGWNNLNGRVYDRPGTLPNSTTPNPNNAFTTDITNYFDGDCCGAGGHQPTLNDWVIAAVPNPQTGGADQEITLIPLPAPYGPSPAPYSRLLPMPVSFALLNSVSKKIDPNALKFPNTVNISTQDANGNTIPLQFPKGFPTTFQCVTLGNKCTGLYGIVLSPAPYTPGKIYNLQIGSDLFSAPVNIPFIVK